MEKDSKIYVAGHLGLVGSGIWRALERHGYTNLMGRSIDQLDLINQQEVDDFFAAEKPEYVVLVAAKVGGIVANNTYRGQFIYENMMIEMNVIHSAYKHGVKKLLFLGSSCIYPKLAPQPLKEEHLLTGPLESTNEPYAIAKIAGIRLCDAYNRQYETNFISAMPTNMYGPGDNYHPQNSHVLPAFIRRFHEAKKQGLDKVTCWGSGSPLREFLYSDDLAEACVFLLENVDYKDMAFEDESGTIQAHVNVGSGAEVTIKELAEAVREVVGYEGEIEWDTSKPDGTPRKLMDSSRLMGMGWKPEISMIEGIKRAYADFKERYTD
ncbi:MAG: GDP-L-fucose synthase [Pontiellaceae bacterium]|nr:GDP-L-fucose synthase [Pontiellaceae bacterium]MBN2784513.1 GDP-L-fucose synthase [Pontiellaceae bacterium]